VALRRSWLVWAVASLVVPSMFLLGGETANSWLGLLFATLGFGWFFFVLIRFGILATVSFSIFGWIGSDFVLTADLSSWYAGRSLTALLALAGLALYGFWVSRPETAPPPRGA